MTQATVTAIGEVELDGRFHTSAPAPLSRDGGTMRARIDDQGGQRVFKVLGGPAPAAGIVRFEKTCMEPVRFIILRDGEPLQEVLLPKMFEAIDVEIAAAFD